jgi:(p)ppGpp synthase/HD superfamily hydrolase
MTEKIFQAIEFATFHHRGQIRKGTSIPYIVHPLGVLEMVARYGGSLEMQIAGLFHDLLEDTKATREEISNQFGTEVLTLVEQLTEPEFPESKLNSWKMRKTHTIEGLETLPISALCISLCDKYDNLYSLEQDLVIFGERLWERFRGTYPEQKWYYTQLSEIYMKRLKKEKNDFYLLAERFQSLLNSLFL